jgi:hypothetical protein
MSRCERQHVRRFGRRRDKCEEVRVVVRYSSDGLAQRCEAITCILVAGHKWAISSKLQHKELWNVWKASRQCVEFEDCTINAVEDE